MSSDLIDLQSSTVQSPFAIDAAGVIGVKYPFTLRDTDGSTQHVSAEWQMGAYIPQGQRGTHMSRFMVGLENLSHEVADIPHLVRWVESLRTKLDTSKISISTQFDWFAKIEAPVTKITALLDHRVHLEFEVSDKDTPRIFIGLKVAAKSLCPCSKAISAYGAHNQRSLISARILLRDINSIPSLADLSKILRGSASSPVFPILKREDEKWITEHAYDNPAFVEDIARKVISNIAQLPYALAAQCEVRNIESIHSHDCFAKISWE